MVDTHIIIEKILERTKKGELVFDTVQMKIGDPRGEILSNGRTIDVQAMVYDGFAIFRSDDHETIKRYSEKLTNLQKWRGIEQTSFYDDISGMSITIYDGKKRADIRNSLENLR